MRKTKLALVGVGYWGPNLLRNLAQNPRIDLAYVVEQAADRRKFVENTLPSLITVPNLDEVLADENLEGLVVATPAHTHFAIAKACLEAGKHLLVEKPLATSLEEVDVLTALAQEKQVVLMSGHTFIFNDSVRFIKNLIESGELGDLRYIYCQRLNLGRIRADVDAWWNLAPHDISVVQYLLGDPEPTEIHRHGQAFVQEEIEDVVFVTIRYPNQVLANIHVSWLDPNKTRKITVVGSKKMVVYDDIAENKIAIYDKGIDVEAKLGERMDYDDSSSSSFVYRTGDLVMPKISQTEPLKNEINHFVDCIADGVDCQTGPDHSRKVVEILSQADV